LQDLPHSRLPGRLDDVPDALAFGIKWQVRPNRVGRKIDVEVPGSRQGMLQRLPLRHIAKNNLQSPRQNRFRSVRLGRDDLEPVSAPVKIIDQGNGTTVRVLSEWIQLVMWGVVVMRDFAFAK